MYDTMADDRVLYWSYALLMLMSAPDWGCPYEDGQLWFVCHVAYPLHSLWSLDNALTMATDTL